MHICHVITRLIIGGAQENTILTCKGLVERGRHVTLIAGPETGPEGSLWNEAEQAGCEVVRCESLRRAVQPITDWQAVKHLRRAFERLKPDVVHTHSSKAGIVAREAARRAGTPIIVHTIHGMSFNRTQPRAIQMLYRWLERRAARNTTMLVTVADAMIDQAVAAGIAPRDRFVTVYSGMKTDAFRVDEEERKRVRVEWGATEDDVVVGTIARLFTNKGYEEIIAAMPEAIARQPKLRFVWLGDGANRNEYRQQLTELGLLDRVSFTGLIPPGDVPAQINGMDIVLHASRWEGLPRALVQGLLTERPAISFDNDGAPEVVIDGETGVLVPYGDRHGLAGAIGRLAGDAQLRDRLGARGRELCMRRFDWRRMVDDLDALYRRWAEDRAARHR